MSLYIVKHFNKFYYFQLKDEYHHTFLNFWKENQTSETVEITDLLKKGILNSKITDYSEKMPYYLFREYCTSLRLWNKHPLWWFLDTTTMQYRMIPQD